MTDQLTYDQLTRRLKEYEKQWGDMDYTIGKCLQENQELKQQLAKLEAACSAYRDAIAELIVAAPHEGEGIQRAIACMNGREFLKSTDAGAGWRSPQEVAAEELVETTLGKLGQPDPKGEK